MKGGIFILEEFGKIFHASFSWYFSFILLFLDVKIETVKVETVLYKNGVFITDDQYQFTARCVDVKITTYLLCEYSVI